MERILNDIARYKQDSIVNKLTTMTNNFKSEDFSDPNMRNIIKSHVFTTDKVENFIDAISIDD